MTKTISILYVEDNSADARLLKEYLAQSHAQYRLHTAASLGGALEFLEGGPVVDIIVCDLGLPDSQGIDTFRKIRARARRTPILVLSVTAGEETALEAVREGAQDYLVKGQFDRESLDRTIRYSIERDRAAKSLSESETRYRSVGEMVPFGVWTAGIDGGITYLSDVFLDMVGMSLDQCKGFGWIERVHPEDGKNMAAAWKECLRTETPWEYQYRIWDRFGDYRTVLSRGTPVRDARGQVISWSGINLDISERMDYIEAIGESKQQLDTVVNTTHILLAYMDPEFNFVWVNRAYAEADGKDPAFFSGKNHFDLFPYGENKEICDEVLRTGKPYYGYARAFEYTDNPERGVSYWDWTLVPTKDGVGNVTGVLSSLADVTERIRMQDSLRVSEEKYRLLVESANSVITVTQDGIIRFINEQVKDLLGYSAEELIGKETAVIFDDDHKEGAWGQSREEISGRALAPSTRQVRHKNGDIRYIEAVGTLMMWEGRPAILNVFTDITERKRAEALIQIRGTLFEYAVSHPLEEMLQRTMDEVCELTGSPIGFFHFVQSDQNTLSLQAWSTRTTGEFCTSPEKGMHYTIETAGVWVECVRQRRPVIHNDYSALTNRKGFPEGHPAVVRELVVPVMRSGQIMAILGVGNKTTNYDQNDVKVVSYLADVAWEIAEEKLADEALRESEQRYRSLFTNILDGFAYHKMVFDEQNRPVDYLYLETNDAFERLTGIKDVVGKRVTEIVPALRKDNPELLEAYGRVSLTGTTEKFETYIPGLNSWFSVSVYSPRKGYFATVFDNITDRKRAEQQLEEAHQNLQLALKAGSAGTWDWDIASDTYVWSKEFREIFGMDPDATAGFETWTKAVHPEDREAASGKVKDAIDKREDLTNDYRIVLPGGAIRWIRAIGKTIYDNSTPVRMTGLCIDITDRKEAEEDLRRNAGINAALAELYEPLTSPGATIHNITEVVLKKALDLTGSAHGYVAEIDPLSNDSLVHAITDMFPKQRRSQAEDNRVRFPRGNDGRYGGLWGHALNTRKAFFINNPETHPAARGVPKGHQHIVRLLSVPVLLGTEPVGQIALANPERDYSERDMEAVRRLAVYYALAIQRVRAEETIVASLAEKEALLREIHHRVKNNLQTVSSLLSMAEMGTKNREAGDLLRDAESRVHAMALIHSQLYGSQRLDRIDVKRNIRELADRLSSIYSGPARDIVHSVEGDDTSLTIHQAIPCALAVNEIVTNSFKYAFEGRQKGAITIRVRRAGSMLSIGIADDGVGLPDRFDIDSAETLGVRLVKDLIEGQLAGKVDFSSEGGTIVTIGFGIEEETAA